MAYPKNLLNIALVLSALTAVLHLYIGLQVYGIPLGVPLILIALVYIGGIALIATNNRRTLWLKIGIYWVIIVIVLWAASAAVNALNTNTPPRLHRQGRRVHPPRSSPSNENYALVIGSITRDFPFLQKKSRFFSENLSEPPHAYSNLAAEDKN